MKHTLGPWTVSSAATPDWNKQYLVYAENHPANDLAIIYACDEAAANARLISAAPDLLSALTSFVEVATPGQDPLIMFAAVERARAAIAKATEE